MILAIIMLIAGIASIATSSIAIQAYNSCNNPDLKAAHPNNYNYLVFNLVAAIALVLGSGGAFYYSMKMPNFSTDALAGSFDKAMDAVRKA